MPGEWLSTPQLMLLKKNQWNINIIYYKSDLDNKRKVQHTTSLCFLDSKSHPACFPFCSISETQDFLRHVNAGALYGPLKPSAAGFCTEKETCMFFFGTCQDLSHSKVNTQHLFLCRPLIKDQMFTAHHSFSGNTWKVMSNFSQMRWGTHVCRRSNLRKQPELKIIKVTAHLPITSDSGVASATENLEVS